MKTYYCIDWISATKPWGESEAMTVEDAQKVFGDVEWRELPRAQKPYVMAVGCQYGEVHWHPNHKEFNVMVRASGAQIDRWRADGRDDEELIKALIARGFRFTRLDIARDVFGVRARPAVIYNKWRMGDLRIKARTITILQTAHDGYPAGETVYIGSRESQKFLRVYDKAEQVKMGLPKEKHGEIPKDWTRLEFELKSDTAVVIAGEVEKHGKVKVFDTLLATHVPRGLPDWAKSGTGEIVAFEATPRKETNGERWLWQVVLPAIRRALIGQVPGFREALERVLAETGE